MRAVLTFALAMLCTAAQAEDLAGPPRIIDGSVLPERQRRPVDRTFIELPNKKTADLSLSALSSEAAVSVLSGSAGQI
jgi:hypothetical protein